MTHARSPRRNTHPSPPSVAIGSVSTPMGDFGALFTDHGLACLTFPAEGKGACEAWARIRVPSARRVDAPQWFHALAAVLTAYFDGELRAFSTTVDLRGTAFQCRVWEALRAIPYGETRSYGYIANAIGLPRAVRAVGAANGANPVPIIVPCHRVIGSNGTLTGYGGGLSLKERLLVLEGWSGVSISGSAA